MNTSTMLGKTLIFAGLSLAVVLGICGFRSNWTTVKLAGKAASISEQDQRARPFFEEAQRNVPAAVAKLTETKTMLKLCWYEFPGKTNDRESQALIQSILEKPIFEPCRKGAAVYGCAINKDAASGSIAEIGKSAVVTTLYSAGGLGLEAVFMRSTLKSMKTIIKAASGRLSKFLWAGAACATADGPFPFGDTIGVTLAVGGTWLCIRDLKAVQKDLAGALEEAIRQAIDEYWNSAAWRRYDENSTRPVSRHDDRIRLSHVDTPPIPEACSASGKDDSPRGDEAAREYDTSRRDDAPR